LLDARTADLFAVTRKSLPLPIPRTWKINLDETNDSFVLTASVGHQIVQAVFFPLVESQIQNAAQQRLLPLASGFQLTLRKSDQMLKPIQRLKGVLALSNDQAYLLDVSVSRTRSGTGIGSAR
jgi:hypothetical protein